VVLPALISEFRLQKKICSGCHSGAVGGGQPLTDPVFEVVPSLVGGVDAAEAHAERHLGESRSTVFLPSGAVEKVGNG